MSKDKTKSLVPARPEWPGWEYFSDLNDGVHVFCLLCAVDGKDKTYKVRNICGINVTFVSDDDYFSTHKRVFLLVLLIFPSIVQYSVLLSF